jgi:membrane protein implicated in regulation of membrane protease activity
MVIELSIYLIIAIVCGVLLIVMAIFGGDFMDMDMDMDFDVDVDVDGLGTHIEPGFGDFATGLSPLSPPLLLAFGASFGAFGTIFETLGYGPIWTPLLAGVLATLMAVAIFYVLFKVFIQSQATTRVNFRTLIGKEAVVTVPIKPGEQGQILIVTEARGRTLITAISADEEIPSDSIIIIEKMTGNIASVRKK